MANSHSPSRFSFLTAALLLGLTSGPVIQAQSQTMQARQNTAPTLSKPLFNHAAKLAPYAEPGWYEQNIPFIDLPDTGGDDTGRETEQIYYYRWNTLKEQRLYGGPQRGFYEGINIGQTGGIGTNSYLDLRWQRTRGLVENEVRLGLLAAPSRYADATAYTLEQYAAATGDQALLRLALPALTEKWNSWSAYYDQNPGLYWHQPVWDATEHSLAGVYTSFKVPGDVNFPDPAEFLIPLNTFFGGYGYAAPLNSYQAADALSIARIAALSGNAALAADYTNKAKGLEDRMEGTLWDNNKNFYYHVMKDNAAQGFKDVQGKVYPDGTKLPGRELFGYVPWEFGLAPDDANHVKAWEQLFDMQGFAAPFGPTTSERRDPKTRTDGLYDPKQFDGNCCRWHGPNWPFSTGRVLQGFANLLNDYKNLVPQGAQGDKTPITPENYTRELRRFAQLQDQGGKPYVAEAADPISGQWIYNEPGFSNDYYHYPYVDLVINGLIGIRPQQGDSVVVNPLAPKAWDHFAAENVPYHGHLLSVVWDSSGKTYNVGSGLSVYQDGALIGHSAKLEKLQLKVAAPVVQDVSKPTRANYAANLSRVNNVFSRDDRSLPFPAASASYNGDGGGQKTGDEAHWKYHADSPTRRNESPANTNDGNVSYNPALRYAKWSTVGAPDAQTNTPQTSWLAVDYGTPRPIDEVRVYLYGDDKIKAPGSFEVQSWNGSDWAPVPGQTHESAAPKINDVNIVKFPAITTQKTRVVFQASAPIAVSELETWGRYDGKAVNCTDPRDQHYEAEDAVINLGGVIGSKEACGFAAVGGLDTQKIYFLDDPSKVQPGDFSAAKTGPLWQGFTEPSFVQFTVDVPEARPWELTVRYANGLQSTATSLVSVNGATPTTVELPPTGGWSRDSGGIKIKSFNVTLAKGRNTIRLTKGDNFAEYDAIDLK